MWLGECLDVRACDLYVFASGLDSVHAHDSSTVLFLDSHLSWSK